MFVVFCKPILAILLQRKHQRRHHASRMLVVFCKPVLAILLQRKRLIAANHCGECLCSQTKIWKAEPTFHNAFSKHFATFASPNRVLTPFNSASKSILKGWFGLPNLRLGGVNLA